MSVFAGSFALAAAAAGVVAARSGSAAEQAPDGASPRRITSWVACGTTLTLVLATPLCAPLWSRLPALAYLQFPWRFLGPGSLGLAVLGGACVLELRRRTSGPIALALTLVACLGITAWNSRYFQAEAQAVVEDDVLANPLQLARMRHGMFDYLPTAVDPAAIPQRPSGARPREAVALPEGSARVRALFRGSHRLALQVEAEHETLLRIQRHDFPRWQVRIDGYAAELEPVDDPRGRLHVRVPAGVHEVTATLEATGARWAGRGLSLLGLLALFALPWLRVRPTPAKGRTQ
jgi:hypothetical protein